MASLGQVVELVVASGKGGVGKSTLTAVLAIELARRGVKLVAADADAEAPNLHLVLGVEKWDDVREHVEGRIAYIVEEKCTGCGLCIKACPFDAIEVVEGKYRINEVVCEGCYTCALVCPEKAIRYRKNIVAGYLRVAKRTVYGFPLVSAEIVPGRPNSGKLVTAVKGVARAILGSEGLLLLDAAAGIGCQVISSMAGAHIAILVAEPTPASLNDLKRAHKLAKHFGLASAVVINKYDLDEDYAGVIEEYARENNMPVLGKIPYDDSVPKSMAQMKPVTELYPDSPASKALREIAYRVYSEILSDWRSWWARYRPKQPEPYVPLLIRPERLASARRRRPRL